MQWYYAREGTRFGPVTEEEFSRLVHEGAIGPDTLVWREGMEDWREFRQVTSGAEAVSGPAFCSQCGRTFPEEEMIQYGGVHICADCKPIFVQKIKEGVALPGIMEYAGFWIRFGAKAIDWIIMWVIQMVLTFGLAMTTTQDQIVVIIVLNVFQLVLAAAYTTFFLGKYGATIGKMACQIKVVSDEGEPITYMRALGRHFAEMLSALILMIGYIMAAFDDEKRALHDRICSTRVIRK